MCQLHFVELFNFKLDPAYLNITGLLNLGLTRSREKNFSVWPNDDAKIYSDVVTSLVSVVLLLHSVLQCSHWERAVLVDLKF